MGCIADFFIVLCVHLNLCQTVETFATENVKSVEVDVPLKNSNYASRLLGILNKLTAICISIRLLG